MLGDLFEPNRQLELGKLTSSQGTYGLHFKIQLSSHYYRPLSISEMEIGKEDAAEKFTQSRATIGKNRETDVRPCQARIVFPPVSQVSGRQPSAEIAT